MMPSSHLKDSGSDAWLTKMQVVEPLLNALTTIIAPGLFDAGSQSISKIKKEEERTHSGEKYIKKVIGWPSVYSGISVISNRTTLFHTDRGGYESAMDLLAACGTHDNCNIEVQELGASFQYRPGAVLFICGFFLQHGVFNWTGDRVCYAHYFKDKVHERNGVQRAGWENISKYLGFMSSRFAKQEMDIIT